MLWLATPAMKLEVLFVGQVYKVRNARMGGIGRSCSGGVWVLSLVQDNLKRGD